MLMSYRRSPPSKLVTVECWFHCVLCLEHWACDHTRNARRDCTNRSDFSSVNQMALVWLSYFTNTAAKGVMSKRFTPRYVIFITHDTCPSVGKAENGSNYIWLSEIALGVCRFFFYFLDICVPFFSLFLCNVNCWQHGKPDTCHYYIMIE